MNEPSPINDEILDAKLFGVEIDEHGIEMVKYLRTNEMPTGWPLRQKRALVV